VPLDDLDPLVAKLLSNRADALTSSTQDQEHRSRGRRLYAQALPHGDLAEQSDFTSDGDNFQFTTGQFRHVLHEDLADAHGLHRARTESTVLLVHLRQER
jgi:hypothetical protein